MISATSCSNKGRTRRRTLVVAVLASLLIASIAAALTGAAWAYTWMLAELVLGSTRICLMMKALARAKADRRVAANITPIWAGLASVILISAGCYQCVGSGVLPLVLMAGIGLANLVGGIASRNAGTPRYGILLICILTLPFALATILSPIPFLFLIGLQTPVYTAGMIFLLLENHKILLDLHHSERNNRQMAHHDLLTGLPNRALNLKLFSELLAGPWPEAGSPGSKLTVFCLDLDGFKGVNDRFGHAAGDAVLVAVAERLRASVPACATPISCAALAATNLSFCCPTLQTAKPLLSPGGSSRGFQSRSSLPRRPASEPASASHRRHVTGLPPMNCCAPPTARCTRPNAAARAVS
jgi:predicted signal transduction protein with EAL and GGDEF domain